MVLERDFVIVRPLADSASCASLILSSAFARSTTTVCGIGYLVMLLYPMKCV
jgi:hypothetical protein